MKRWDDWYNIISIIANAIMLFSVIGVGAVIISVFNWVVKSL